MTTQALYRVDAYRRECEATIMSISDAGVELDRTVFYPMSGGQAGDRGEMLLADGRRIAVVDTRKSTREGSSPDDSVHVLETQPGGLASGMPVRVVLDWTHRHRLMRYHTTTHLLCALIPHPVNGCSITADYARIDFDMVEPLDRESLQQGLDQLIAAAHETSTEWISDEEMLANPDLVRTMSVKPPLGFGRIRLLRIADVDLQPCGGTHVANTREIGPVNVAKIEKKSARTRRVNLRFPA